MAEYTEENLPLTESGRILTHVDRDKVRILNALGELSRLIEKASDRIIDLDKRVEALELKFLEVTPLTGEQLLAYIDGRLPKGCTGGGEDTVPNSVDKTNGDRDDG